MMQDYQSNRPVRQQPPGRFTNESDRTGERIRKRKKKQTQRRMVLCGAIAALELPSISYDFAYTIDGNKLMIDYANESVRDSEYEFTVDGNTLTLIGGEGTVGRTYELSGVCVTRCPPMSAINSKMLPADAGCIVDNVATMVAVYHAVKEGKPVTSRIFTVTGDAVEDPGNFEFLIGTSFQELLDAAGGFKEQPEKIISGGPMMGFSMFGLDVPTTKTTSALLCMTKDEVAEADADATACINCGRCVEACPEQIVPSRLSKFSEHGDMAEFEKWHGLECVECGSCSFICPAKRPLAQLIKTMKKQVLAEKKKNK